MRLWFQSPTLQGWLPPSYVSVSVSCSSTNVEFWQSRYSELTLALRIWVHLRQVRRGGGVHTLGGFGALAPGSLAVECPAWPHPGRNLVCPKVDR